MKEKAELSEIFKAFQDNIKKKDTFYLGKKQLLQLRYELIGIYDYIFTTCSLEDYIKMPLSTDKTIAYYIYHLARIEDITSNTLILGNKQIFFKDNYDELLNSPIITTGNELQGEELVKFSSMLNIKELRNYSIKVLESTNVIINNMTYEDSKIKVSKERKEDLLKLETVAKDKNSFWLIDYWCKKTYGGLLSMPFSRHHMLHLQGSLRIINKIKK